MVMTSVGLSPETRGSDINAVDRAAIAKALKSVRFDIAGSLPISEAFVTAGGVSLAEVDPRTMASRLVQGLYFCGEILDLDAETGGYNLQAAFSTGWIAGESAAGYVTAGRSASQDANAEYL
jgi:predicted flavoprotein YhiN